MCADSLGEKKKPRAKKSRGDRRAASIFSGSEEGGQEASTRIVPAHPLCSERQLPSLPEAELRQSPPFELKRRETRAHGQRASEEEERKAPMQRQNTGVIVLHRPHLTPFSVAPPSAEELAHSAALEQVRRRETEETEEREREKELLPLFDAKSADLDRRRPQNLAHPPHPRPKTNRPSATKTSTSPAPRPSSARRSSEGSTPWPMSG